MNESEQLHIEEEEYEYYDETGESDDDETAFLQTRKALNEAIAEQKVLKEKLLSIETRNKPAKWNKPVIIQRLDTSDRGNVDNDAEMSAEQIIAELKTAQHMLENAKRASETAKNEKAELENEIAQLVVKAEEEIDTLLQSNAAHHRAELMFEQMKFREQQAAWAHEKSELLSRAEHLSLISHEALHKSTESREFVDNQRKKIQTLANELKHDLAVSKKLKEKLDDAKYKVALIPNLTSEIDVNKRQADTMNKNITEQKQILKAVRVSKQAQAVLDDIAKQTEELEFSKSNSEKTYESAKEELEALKEKEKRVIVELEAAREKFKEAQMNVFVTESELKDMKAEFQRVKNLVIEEGRKNVELQKTMREQKMEAAMRYIRAHSKEIHRSDKVHSSLMNVRDQFNSRVPSILPPLNSSPTPKSSLR